MSGDSIGEFMSTSQMWEQERMFLMQCGEGCSGG